MIRDVRKLSEDFGIKFLRNPFKETSPFHHAWKQNGRNASAPRYMLQEQNDSIEFNIIYSSMILPANSIALSFFPSCIRCLIWTHYESQWTSGCSCQPISRTLLQILLSITVTTRSFSWAWSTAAAKPQCRQTSPRSSKQAWPAWPSRTCDWSAVWMWKAAKLGVPAEEYLATAEHKICHTGTSE